MKKLIVVIMLLISSFSYYGAVDENGEKITDLQNIVGVENEVQNEVAENEIQEIAEENTVDEVSKTENIEQVEIAQEQPKEETKVSQNVNTEISTQPKENKQPEIQKTTPKQEQVNTSVAETPKKEEPAPQPVTKTLTPDDLEYWCVAGGTHHVAGDGANEHGYYSSWDEANQAFLNYTKGWASEQHKIDSCSCGKFYFWAIQ